MTARVQEFMDSVIDSTAAMFLPDAVQEGTGRRPPSPDARHIDDWHEDMGDVLWWTNPVSEAPWVGTPLDLGIGYELSIGGHSSIVHLGGWPGYHEWWTPIPAPPETFTPPRNPASL